MITLTEAKLYLRFDSDELDDEIAGLIEAAVQHIASVGVDVTADPTPAPVKQAALMMISFLHENHITVEGDQPQLSPVFYRLLAPYREIAL